MLSLFSLVAAHNPIALYEYSVPSSVLISRFHTEESIVQVAVDTDIPSLNLDNVPGIIKIRCNEAFVRLTVESLSPLNNITVGEEGILLQIGSHWKCDNSGKTVFRKASSLYTNERTAYFYAKHVEMAKHTNKIDIEVGTPREYNKDLKFDWDASGLPIINNNRLLVQCQECNLEGNAAFKVTVLPRHHQVPKVDVSMNGEFGMKMDMKMSKNMLSALQVKSFELFRKEFSRIELPGIVTAGICTLVIDRPVFLVDDWVLSA